NLLILYLITQLFVRFLSFLFLFALYLNHKLTNNHLILYDVLLNFVSLLLIDLNNSIDSLQFYRSEEHTSELQSRFDLVCRLLLEKKKISSMTIILHVNTLI